MSQEKKTSYPKLIASLDKWELFLKEDGHLKLQHKESGKGISFTPEERDIIGKLLTDKVIVRVLDRGLEAFAKESGNRWVRDIQKKCGVSEYGKFEEIVVNVPPAYIKFGGFSTKGVKQYFPKREEGSFILSFFGKEQAKAYNSWNRIKIARGSRLFEKYGVIRDSRLRIQVVQKLRHYKIVEIIQSITQPA